MLDYSQSKTKLTKDCIIASFINIDIYPHPCDPVVVENNSIVIK